MRPDEWFTVETADADTYIISEYRHAEQTHCYLLTGKERAVLIDTGLGISDIRAVVSALTALPVTVLSTHVHWDHIGGHGAFSDIAVFYRETEWLSGAFPLSLECVRRCLLSGLREAPADFNIDHYEIYQGGAGQLLFDGEELDLGGRRLHVVHTPGHSPGHVCLWEPRRGYLFSGDLIYEGMLDAFYPSTDPLLFMRSVMRVEALPVKRIFPGHHRLNISPQLIGRISDAFRFLLGRGELYRGAGIFSFGDFGIHI